MPQNDLTYRDFARFASQTPDEIARDCDVSVFRATGPGGQGVNTTDSAVRMKHVPTGIVVTARDSRSQYRNRLACLEKLRLVFARKARPPKDAGPPSPQRETAPGQANAVRKENRPQENRLSHAYRCRADG